MVEAIDQLIGESSKKEWPFNLDKLEKQALLYLKLEDDLATDENKNRMPVLSFKRIIAACCYLQYFQNQDQIMINDVLQACQRLNVKAIKALDFIDKWAAHLKMTIPAHEDIDFPMDFSIIEDQFELIRFSKEVKRKTSKKSEDENSKNFYVPADLCTLEDILIEEEKLEKATIRPEKKE